MLVLAGRDRTEGPGALAEPVAIALPRGEFHAFDDLSHFGPMEDPIAIAARIESFCSTWGAAAQ